MVLKNRCNMQCCVNPDHYHVISKDEWLRSRTTWKSLSGRIECSYGHQLTKNNTYAKRGRRNACRICQRSNWEKWREKKRLEDWQKFGELIDSLELSNSLSPAPKKYYVYHLINPITQTVFYVGNGCGNRVFQHEKDILAGAVIGNQKKEAIIQSIWSVGAEVQFSIVQRNLTEACALWLEQIEINRIGINNLTNKFCGTIPSKYRKFL